MTFEANPLALLFAAAAAMSAALGVFAWQRRSIPTARSFAALMCGQTVWALGSGLELVFADLQTKELCYDFKMLGVVSVPLSFVGFVAQYTGRQSWLTIRRVALACVVPLITIAVVWTDPWHHLYFAGLEIKSFDGFAVMQKSYGPYFWVHAGYCYALMVLAVVLLTRTTIQPHGLYRVQVGVILFGALLPWFVNVLDLLRMSPVPNIDLTAITFSLTGLVVVSGLARFQILNIVPVARDRVVQGMRDAVIVLDPLGRIVDINESGQRVLGRAACAVIGTPAQAAFSAWTELSHRLAILDESPLETAAPGPRARLFYEANLSRVSSGSQQIGWVLTLHEISEHKRAEQERRRLIREQAARAEAEAANRAKDRFLAVLSHELRTPLTPVLAAVSGLLEDGVISEDVRAVLDMTRRNVELEARLIDDLLDVTRIARGKLSLDREITDVHQVIRQAVDICLNDIAQAGLRLELDLAAAFHYAKVDPARMEQVVWNLLKNAVKFTPEGGSVAIRSHNAATSAGVLLVIRVADTGIGIEAEALSRIFEAFEQAGDASLRRFGGLGLGLAISRTVIELHGGRLTASSAGPGQGATFTIELVSAAAPVARNDERPTPEPAGLVAPAALKFLIVEDNRDTLHFLSQILQSRGHDVTSAESLAAARRAAGRAGPFDILLSDIELPDGTGLDLMRELGDRCVLVGIAMSGYGTEDDVRSSHAAGFSAHLVKPIRFDTLMGAIEGVLPSAACAEAASSSK